MSAVLERVLGEERRQQCTCNDAHMAKGEPIAGSVDPTPLPTRRVAHGDHPSIADLYRTAMTRVVIAAVFLTFAMGFAAGHLVGATTSPRVKLIAPTEFSMKKIEV